jgi:hypothetical protein
MQREYSIGIRRMKVIRNLVVDTSNWWFGKQVVIQPTRVKAVVWAERRI